MFWSSISQKLKHFKKILLTYLSFESTLYQFLTQFNWIHWVFLIIILAFFI